MLKHLVLSGGGPNGIAQLGAIAEFVRQGKMDPSAVKTIYGCSAGAMIAVLLALHIPLDAISDYIIQRPWQKFLSKIDWTDVNQAGGVLSCTKIIDAVEPLFKAYDIPLTITFEDAYAKTGVDLHIVCTSLTTFDNTDFHHGTHPTMPVATAMALSSALLPIFAPGIYEGETYVDGGFSNNFPLSMCLSHVGLEEAGAVLAVSTVGKMPELRPNMTMFEYLMLMFNKMLMRLSRVPENHEVAVSQCPYYVKIPTISMFDRNLWEMLLASDETGKRGLFQAGVDSAQHFLQAKSAALFAS
jgi:predicted acylesterase/phospholipase RssA